MQVFLILVAFSVGSGVKPYAPFGIWSKKGLSASASHGFFSEPDCAGMLFQWGGRFSYSYTPEISGTGAVQIRGGNVDGENTISTTQYWASVQRDFDFSKSYFGVGFGFGLSSSALSSSYPEEEFELCPDFNKDNSAGVIVSLSGSRQLLKYLWFTSYGRYGVNYSGRIIDETGLGLALDVREIWPTAFDMTRGLFLYSDFVWHYKNGIKKDFFDFNFHFGFGIRL